jgi:hypothetical protein
VSSSDDASQASVCRVLAGEGKSERGKTNEENKRERQQKRHDERVREGQAISHFGELGLHTKLLYHLINVKSVLVLHGGVMYDKQILCT